MRVVTSTGISGGVSFDSFCRSGILEGIKEATQTRGGGGVVRTSLWKPAGLRQSLPEKEACLWETVEVYRAGRKPGSLE